MSKDKFKWIIALFLIIIFTLPIAYAQIIPAGTKIYFVLINAAIIFVLLFILQSFLITQKTDKEKTSVWVIMLLASLLLGYFFGQNGFLWQEGQPLARFFKLTVLVNTIIISAVLYFTLGLLKINEKLGSPEGKTGYGILIFLVALIFAVQIGDRWVWQQNVINQFISYLFGPEGVMNPSPPAYRLWTLIGSITLLAFFFNNYLIKGGNTRLNYVLAIVLGANMASSGISINSVIKLGEVIFVIILAETLGNTTTKSYGINWIIAAFLVGWASYAMTSGTPYSGIASWIFSTGLPWAGWGIWQLLKFIVIVAVGILAYGGIKKLISGVAGGTP